MPPLPSTIITAMQVGSLASADGADVLPRRGGMGALADVGLFTIRVLPESLTVRLASSVCVRAVKVISQRASAQTREQRDVWWSEVRNEIRTHARALGCNAVTGYHEQTTFHDDLCVLSATGTAVYLTQKHAKPACAWAHARRRGRAAQFAGRLFPCGSCNRHAVPEVLIATIDPPPMLLGKEMGLVEARVCRVRRRAGGDTGAAAVSDALPFVEYELHRQLIRKLRLRGCNCLFSLRTSVAVGEGYVIGTAQGTAVCVLITRIVHMI